MHTGSSESEAGAGRRLERAIVLQLLRDDREPRWSREELRAEIGAEALALEEAIGRLRAEGILGVEEARVWASRAARRLDELGLIGV